MKYFLRYWLPVVVYVLAVWGVSLFGRIPLAAKIAHYDKLIHGLEYFLLALLVARALQAGWRRSRLSAAACSLALVSLFGGLDELIQRLNPARTAEILDLMADIAGALAGVGLYTLGRLLIGKDRKEIQASTSRSTSSSR